MIGRGTSDRRPPRAYHLYGVRLRSEWPLPYRRGPDSWLAEVGLFQGSPSRVSADGRAIAACPLRRGSREAFHTYLLGQALSFALIKQGFDPLHATTVAID